MNVSPGIMMLSKTMDEERKQNEFQRKMMIDAYMDQKRQMERDERERNEPWRKAAGLVGTVGGGIVGGVATGGSPMGVMAGASAGGALGSYVGGMGLKGQEMGDPALLQQGLQTGLQAYAMKSLQDKYATSEEEQMLRQNPQYGMNGGGGYGNKYIKW